MYPENFEKYVDATRSASWHAIAALNGCAHDTWGTKKEFAVLPKYLEEDETVLALASGLVSQTGTSNSTDFGLNTWLVVLTNERFLFLDHALLTSSVDTQSVRLDRVQAVSSSQGFLLGKIIVDLSARVIIIDNCQKKDVGAMVAIANRLLKDGESASLETSVQSPPPVDYVEQLAKLGALRNEGILTDEEFSEAKRKILALI